jgi:3-methyladenine DNA glycosylase/8-oxoguanine DNA glycosylase
MEFFTIFVIVTVVVFIMVAGMGMWATGVFPEGDAEIRNARAHNRRVEKLTREKLRHDREMARYRRHVRKHRNRR